MRKLLGLASSIACLALSASPAAARTEYSVSCRIGSEGTIVSTRHEPRDIYDHAHLFPGRSHQSPSYRGVQYRWAGWVPITDSLHSEYRRRPWFNRRPAFSRIGSTDGAVYVFVQTLGCLFDRYLPRPKP
ncbi:hypothetical protein [Allosphingosinicella sp.]|jgi:hypothetical protein|uniref:hypothetical protein n=1 Tax=Allosphingosinicella sp. TaxID=2823234 RepID=UPI002F1814F1